MSVIRNEIRRLRFEHGEMRQQELAEKINLTRQTVNAIEQGKYSPSLEAAFRISVSHLAHFYGTGPGYDGYESVAASKKAGENALREMIPSCSGLQT
jgi:putative transcriptional regulator